MSETRALIDTLASNLGDALGAMTGLTVRTMPAAGDVAIEWQTEIEVGGTGVGTVFIGLSHEGATQLVAAILGDPSLVADADIVDSLKELLGQAAGAHVTGPGQGLTLHVTTPAPAGVALPPDGQVFDLLVGAGAPIRLAGWGRVIAGLSNATPSVTAARPVREDWPVGAPAPVAGAPPPFTGPSVAAPRNLDVVLDIELPITVRFGETQMTLESLARLGPGSMIDLDRTPDDPVELLVNGHLVARGQVVVVSGCYGVRINEVVSPADRLRTLQL